MEIFECFVSKEFVSVLILEATNIPVQFLILQSLQHDNQNWYWKHEKQELKKNESRGTTQLPIPALFTHLRFAVKTKTIKH